MAGARRTLTAQEPELLDAARGGDEGAYTTLVEAYRSELHAHCYRMLGSVHDTEDALQDALLRAWRGLAKFDGRSSLRNWLYRIATNTCLDVIARRPKRVLPIDQLAAADPHGSLAAPLIEEVATWVEPYPDQGLAIEDGYAAPEARYERRESVELAFIAALQHLPGNQRAALILRDVLGFSAKEVAETLDTTTASVNSALQRARAAVDQRLPEQSQQATLRALDDDELREVVKSFMEAMERDDVDAVVAMLTEDAAWSMPPAQAWYRGHEAITGFLREGPLTGDWSWRHLASHANGQAACASYIWDPNQEAHVLFSLNVFTLRGGQIADITAFVTRTAPDPESRVLARWPDQPADPARVAVFERFGLPDRLD